jgi:hypothetical protein
MARTRAAPRSVGFSDPWLFNRTESAIGSIQRARFRPKPLQALRLAFRPLSLDEKPGIQALQRKTHSDPVDPTRVELEYERKGARNLFAAFDIKTGQVLVWSTPSRAIPWVLSFLDQILRWVRRGPIAIITPSTRGSDSSSLVGHRRCEAVGVVEKVLERDFEARSAP